MISYPDTEFGSKFAAYYFGYYDDAHVDNSLQLGGCPISASHEFLAIWKQAGSSPPDFANQRNATALFCKPSYTIQDVEATVSEDGTRILSVTPLDHPEALPGQMFNIPHFERLIANGIVPQRARQDIAEQTVVYQDSKLANMSLTLPTSNMIGFAIGSAYQPADAYLRPEVLADALGRAHKLLFALAISAVIDNTHDSIIPATLHRSYQSIVVVPSFAIASQAVLCLILALTTYLLCTTTQRKQLLQRDPDTLASLANLLDDHSVRGTFRNLDTADHAVLQGRLQQSTVSLLGTQISGQPSLAFEEVSSDIHMPGTSCSLPSAPQTTLQSPMEYRLALGLTLCLFLSGLIVALLWLLITSRRDTGKGISLPCPIFYLLSLVGFSMLSSSVIVRQILFNYLPTLLATVMEPLWVLLCRVTALMTPLEELQKRRATASRSLLLRYSSVPPQLLAWRALVNRHWLLMALSAAAILANVLTVALSGLFLQSNEVFIDHRLLKPQRRTQFKPEVFDVDFGIRQQNSQNDAFWVLQSNFSEGTDLPAWTTAHTAFLPLDFDTKDPDVGAGTIRAELTGYGADLDCQELTRSASRNTFEVEFDSSASLLSLITVHDDPSTGKQIKCRPRQEVTSANSSAGVLGQFQQLLIQGNSDGLKALEFSGAATSAGNGGAEEETFCNSLLVKAWLRANLTRTSRVIASPTPGSHATDVVILSETVIACQPRLRSTLFNVTFTPSGLVQSTIQLTDPLYSSTALTNLSIMLSTTTTALSSTQQLTWHDDLVATDWSNYLIKILTSSADFLDPQFPAPDARFLAIPYTQEIFSRLFVVQFSLLTPQLRSADSSLRSSAAAAHDPPLDPIHARRTTQQPRILISEPAFYVAISILTFDLVVAVLFYLTRPAAFLPRLPLSIASQIAYLANSRVVDDVIHASRSTSSTSALSSSSYPVTTTRETGADKTRQGRRRRIDTMEHGLRRRDKEGWRYGFGKYVGKDGRVHMGVEREPFVF